MDDRQAHLTVDASNRRLIIQEDPGNQEHLAAIWSYDLKSDRFTKVAQHTPRASRRADRRS